MKNFIIFLLIFFFGLSVLAQKASLRGSRSSLIKQNREANKEDLSRIENDKKLQSMVKNGYLVKITNKVNCDSRLVKKFRYCRPWTNLFLKNLSEDFAKKFGKDTKLQINSAMRTVEYQEKLRKTNGNAAKAKGIKASSHPTGATIDIAKLNLSQDQLEWMRKYLLNLEENSLIEATEEKHQAVFHIMVFKEHVNKRPRESL